MSSANASRRSDILEADVLNAARAEAKRLKVPVLRCTFMRGTTNGWPDCIFFIPGGRPLIVEFKRPGGTTTKLQGARIAELRSLGYDVRIIDDPDEARRAIVEAVQAARLSGQSEGAPAVDSLRGTVP